MITIFSNYTVISFKSTDLDETWHKHCQQLYIFVQLTFQLNAEWSFTQKLINVSETLINVSLIMHFI